MQLSAQAMPADLVMLYMKLAMPYRNCTLHQACKALCKLTACPPQARALLFLTTLSNALLEALSSVSEAVSDLQLQGRQHIATPEQKSSPVVGTNNPPASRAGSAQGILLLRFLNHAQQLLVGRHVATYMHVKEDSSLNQYAAHSQNLQLLHEMCWLAVHTQL